MNGWNNVLELDGDRSVTAGSPEALRAAIRRGADLRIYTEFRHNEHVAPGAPNGEIVREVSDFEVFRYFVRDEWREVLAHDADGRLIRGSLDGLADAFAAGAEIKVGIRRLCGDLGSDMDHELLVHTGPGYYSTQRRIFCAGTQPLVRWFVR